MKNLLFFASDFQIGLSALLTDQLISIATSGANVIAVAGENEQENGLANSLSEHSVNLIRINGLDIHHNFRGLVKQIERIVVENNIKVIHVQNNWQLAIAGVVKTKLKLKNKVKIIYTLHGFRNNHPMKARVARLIIGTGLFVFANHVICMTKYLKKNFSALSYKITLLPLGVKDDYFSNHFTKPDTSCLKLIFPAQFREGKNQDLIIRTFAKYVEATRDKDATLTLPGSGPLIDKMKLLSANLGVSNQVLFPGFVAKDRIKELYLSSNIAVVASNSETFGQSIVEPYVLGRCIISTPVGIAPEIIKHDNNGYLFNNEKQLYEILIHLNENKSMLETIGHNNFNRKEIFNWKSITKKYISEFL